jgi:hypothetical protein
MLRWKSTPEAVKYVVTRSFFFEGPYQSPRTDRQMEVVDTIPGTSVYTYEDRNVVNGTAYWYLVQPYFASASPTPVCKFKPEPDEAPAKKQDLRQRRGFNAVRQLSHEHKQV